ncbi:hypothetical protein PAPYR_10257 [Paratrimastix pyriformis]|uniref:Uncharacterized protein n=1 Tax=Paratrimastix pyriformis TaxID=342808 RepID=A0ABQ8UC07_9EUKA|nr:hypothetical protein PAPYR_10257 [Paratrimastix pyriformis]
MLIGLTQWTRTRLLGTIHEMSFEDPDLVEYHLQLIPTADALAALLGPCKGLVKLSFPNESAFTDPEKAPLLFGCGATEAACAAWVDEAFAGHDRLTTLRLPREPFLPALGRILGHLPGLVELHIMSPSCGYDPGSAPRPGVFRIMAALHRSMPPALSVLRLDWPVLGQALKDLVAALAPIATTLEELHLPYVELGAEVHILLGRLPSLRRLTLESGSIGSLQQPVAARLTQLTVGHHSGAEELFALPDGGGRLEALSFGDCGGGRTVSCLLTPNQNTLRHIALGSPWEDEAAVDLLASLTHLTSLELTLGPTATGFFGAVPPELLDRLEHLALSAPDSIFPSFGLAGKRLRSLYLNLTVGHSATVTLDCPALETITGLPQGVDPYTLVMDCPWLRSLQGLPVTAIVRWPAVMPHLVRVGAEPPGCEIWGDSWLPQLLAAGPRLHEVLLGDVRLCSRKTVNQLFAAKSLRRIRIALGERAYPPSFDTRVEMRLLLPAQLTHADITMPYQKCFVQRVVAKGLRSLRLRGDSEFASQVIISCPALESLTIGLGGHVSFQVDEGFPGYFELEDCVAGAGHSLEEFLTFPTGAAVRLRRCVLRLSKSLPGRTGILVPLLEQLPMLTSLVLDDNLTCTIPAVPFSLASPSLRHLCITGLRVADLELNCPLLEELWATFKPLRRFTLTGSVTRGVMRRIGLISTDTWANRMGRLFPGAVLVRNES